MGLDRESATGLSSTTSMAGWAGVFVQGDLALSSVCLNALVCFGKCFVLKSTHLWIWVALQGGVATFSSPPPAIGLSPQGLVCSNPDSPY